ncbi:polysaccharide deacetylase family protein [Streptomyces sp. NPDC004539]|uniref:polysaccharide deacetylase family protein n=1 Tax=Streptomyces sp. NPDC004539 TaxID=3154280 RepID=UPI0033BEF5B7
MRKSSLFPSLVLLGSLSLTAACSSGVPASPGSEPGDGPAGSSPANGGHTVDPARIRGLEIVTDSSEHGACRYAASYPAVPGAERMTSAMQKDVEQRVDTFRTGSCEGDAAAEGSAELNISYEFLAASGDVLGVRLTTRDGSAAGSGLSNSTYWYDGEDQAARTALDLVDEASQDDFVSALKEKLKSREGVDAASLDGILDDPANRTAVVDDMVFTADGGLTATFDRGEVGVPAADQYVVTFPKTAVAPWLSDFGKRVQRQTGRPSGGLDLGATHEPEPSVPVETASEDDTTDCAQVTCIALTFDDGPAAPETATLLTYLARYKARATFFTVGQNVAAHPELVRAESDAGHEIGNHSWNHPDLTGLTPDEVRSQLERTSTAIEAATGKAPTLFRPPYGAVNDTVKAATTLSPVLWDVDTEDWKHRDAAKVARTVIDKAKPNDVVLMHDIHPTSVAAVPEILRTLTERGFHFVTVSRLRAAL